MKSIEIRFLSGLCSGPLWGAQDGWGDWWTPFFLSKDSLSRTFAFVAKVEFPYFTCKKAN